MEFLIYRQDPSQVFHGDKPKTLEDLEKAYFLAGGSSIVNSSTNQRKPGHGKITPNNIRILTHPNISLLEVLQRRLNVTANPDDENIGQPTNTVIPSLVQCLNKPQNQKMLLRQMNVPSNIKKLPLPHGGGIPRDPRPITVLNALLNWLQADRMDLYFDWREFQEQSTKTWIDFLIILSRDPEWQETEYVQTFQRTSKVAALDILFLSVNSEQTILDLRIPDAIVAPQLRRLADVIQRNIHQPFGNSQTRYWAGDTCIRRLTQLCSATWFLANPGPCHFNQLYKNWSREDLRRSAVLAFITIKLREVVNKSDINPTNQIALTLLERLAA